ncbi:MAG: DNA internalization-related competence protein ComEC/Rec2 [Gammaproteobacteria bacterium]
MTKAQPLGISLGVVLAVLLPTALWSAWLGASLFLVVFAGRWVAPLWLRPLSASKLEATVFAWTLRFLFSLGIGLFVAGVQFYAYEDTKIMRVDKRHVEGCIISRVVTRENTSRFVFALEARNALGRAIRYRVAWRTQQPPKAGSCWQLQLRLKPLRGTRNVVGFDYERWLFAQRFSGLGSVKADSGSLLPRQSRNAAYLHAREKMYQRVKALIKEKVSGPLVLALAVGIREDLTDSDWVALKRSGTAHLMAISGLHIGLAALVGFSIGRYVPVWLRPHSNLLRRGALTALLVAVSYAAVAGFAVSTIRALVMLSLWHVWRVSYRSVNVTTTLLLAVSGLLLCNPWMAADTGFWLSAGAVAAIALSVYGRPPAVSWRDKLKLALRLQVSVTLLMLPVSITVAEGLSWISVPLNLLLIPLFSLCIVPMVLLLLLSIALSPYLAQFVASVLGSVLDVVWRSVMALASQSWAYSEASSLSLWLTIPISIGAALMLCPPKFPARWAVLIMVLPLFIARSDQPGRGHFRLDVLDVGQALSVVIQTQSHTVVYDTGNSWPGGDSARQTILPFLKRRRIERVDALVISHADRDHAGGSISLQQSMPTQMVYVGETVERLSGSQFCRRDLRWTFDEVEFVFLHPPDSVTFEGNQQSCVLLVKGPTSSVLLTGDLGNALERRLLPALKGQAIDLVIGAHHGSLSSSDPRFIKQVKPSYVVFSNGYGNQWGMPRAEIVQRWSQEGTRVLTTAQSGQLVFTSSEGESFQLHYTAREPSPGLWRWLPERQE